MTRKSLVAFAVLLLSQSARAQEEYPVGTRLVLPVVSVSVWVSGNDREFRRAVYAPPPGWYVRSHQVFPQKRRGSVSYTVSTIPTGWLWHSREQVMEDGHSNTAAVLSAYQVSGGGQAEVAEAVSTSEMQTNTSSHHLLVVDVAARGGGFWKGESGVDLIVVAEMVYLGR